MAAKVGFSQAKLGRALGVSTMAVGYWEWGSRCIPALLPLALEALENRMKEENKHGIMVECPECKKRNNAKAKICSGELVDCPQCGRKYNPEAKICPGCKKPKTYKGKKENRSLCGFNLAKFSGRVWWIEYYDHDKRLRRERIGNNKAAAEQRYREVMSARTEVRYIKKCPETRRLFKDLASWYLELPEVKAKRSYDRDQRSLFKLLPFFGERMVKDINPAMVEAYKQTRLNEPSGRTPKYLTKPATVNRELACLKTIFSKALKNDKAERNPTLGVKMLKENNERDRILSQEEYIRLLTPCPGHLKPIVKLAYCTGMRQGEILNLTWA
jgi:hypothetical protein